MKLFGIGKDPEAALWEFVRKNLKSSEDASRPAFQHGLSKALGRIHEDLAWGCGSAADGNPVLEISGGGLHEMIPVVKGLVSRAPTIPGVEIVAFKQPVGYDIQLETPFGKVDGAEMRWRPVSQTDGKEDLFIYVPVASGTDEDILAQLGFIFLDHTLGEYIVMTRVGLLGFTTVDKAPEDAQSFASLADHFKLGISREPPTS